MLLRCSFFFFLLLFLQTGKWRLSGTFLFLFFAMFFIAIHATFMGFHNTTTGQRLLQMP